MLKLRLLACLTILTLLPCARAQSRHDPLTDQEVDDLREVADRPPERVKLFMKFIDDRTTAIQGLLAHAKDQNRSERLHTLLDEFTYLVDELGDNLDGYASNHDDIRKPLKILVDDSAKWPELLKKIPPDRTYDFALKSALDAAQSTADSVKELQTEQEKYFKEHPPGKEDKKKSSD